MKKLVLPLVVIIGCLLVFSLSSRKEYISAITEEDYALAVAAASNFCESKSMDVQVIAQEQDHLLYGNNYKPGEIVVFNVFV